VEQSTTNVAPVDAIATVLDEGKPRYMRIFATLRERIEQGVYPIGSSVPTEADLCDEFEVSRYTVREALRRLVAAGMVDRRKGSGTQVIAKTSRASYVQSMGSLSDLFQYALDTHFEIETLHSEQLSPADAATIGTHPGEVWTRIEGIRLSRVGGTPICATTVFVAPRFRTFLHDVVGARVPIYSIVETRSGEPIVEAIQEISACKLERRQVKALGVPQGAWALRLLRRYVGADGRPMVCSINWHPADSYSYTMRIERGLMG
jgi:GntR family transcriptional regulator